MRIEIDGVIASCHSKDGPFWLAYKRPREIAIMDSCSNLIRTGKKLIWYKVTNENKFDMFGKHKNIPCYIIGKGPSLDDISKDSFEPDNPILCCNDSIHKVLTLDLPNPIYGIVCDGSVKDTVVPNIRIINATCCKNFEDHDYQWCSHQDLDVGVFMHVGHMSVGIARAFGCSSINFIGFDGAFGGITDYAKVIGYSAKSYGPTARFKQHKHVIINAVDKIPYTINGKPAPQAFPDIPLQSSDNPLEQCEGPDSQRPTDCSSS